MPRWLLTKLLSTSFVQSAILKAISNAAIFAGTGIIALAEAHGVGAGLADKLGGETTGLILDLLGAAWQIADHYIVSGKLEISAAALPDSLTPAQIATLLAKAQASPLENLVTAQAKQESTKP